MQEVTHDEWRSELARALEDANVPTLLVVLFHLTGDRRWLGARYRPSRAQGLDVNDSGGLSAEVQDEVREAALEALLAWRAGAPVAVPEPDTGLLSEMMSFAVGEAVPDDQVTMLAEEIGLRPREVDWSAVSEQQRDGLDVLVIGAGASGLCAAIKLKAAGLSFEVIEKNTEVGGTWWENSYPGAGVDTPGHLYAFSFDSRRSWSRYYPLRDEIEGYFRDLVPRHGLEEYITFGCEVLAATYDEDEAQWAVRIRRPTGEEYVRRARIVVSAVGQLNRPFWPDIDGLESFPGPVVHSGQWPADLDLTGKRVGLVGSGASGFQVAPAIVDRVASLAIFQRSPGWTAPNEHYLRELSPGVNFLVEEVPFYLGWYRFRLLWMFNDGLYSTLQIDPDWTDPEHSINAVNDRHRAYFTRYLREQLGDRADLVSKLLPDYPPFGKRILMDAGWFDVVKRDHVSLDTTGIAAVEGDVVVTSDGSRYELDVLILATGFQSRRFLWPMEITGRGGKRLDEAWGDDDATAYLGMTVPDFPNLFLLYGPNTNLGHGGSIVFHIECQVRYLMSLLQTMAAEEIVEFDCRADVCQEYVARVDEAHRTMIWSHPGMRTWYRNSVGRVVSNSPWRLVDYWRMTQRASLEDYLVKRRPRKPPS